MRRHDGEWRWLETHARHFSTADDRVQVVVIARDVTQQIFDAAAQRAHTERLQEVSRLRSLETLAQGVAHDFNNLIVGVLGNLELTLADGRVPASVVPCLEDARAAGLPRVEGDSTQLRQVVVNLVLNGSDAIVDRGGGIDLSLRAVGRRIFGPFFSTKFLGRGLGLAAGLGQPED